MLLLFTACQKFHQDTSSGFERYPKAIKMLCDRRTVDLEGRAAQQQCRSCARLVQRVHTQQPGPCRDCHCADSAGMSVRAPCPVYTEDTIQWSLQKVSPYLIYHREAFSPAALKSSAAIISCWSTAFIFRDEDPLDCVPLPLAHTDLKIT